MRREKGDNESFNDTPDRFLDEKEHPLYSLVALAEEAEFEQAREDARSFRVDLDSRMGTDEQV